MQQVICEDLKFSFMLPGEATQCFLEEIKEDHVATFSIKSESSRIIMSVSDSKGA